MYNTPYIYIYTCNSNNGNGICYKTASRERKLLTCGLDAFVQTVSKTYIYVYHVVGMCVCVCVFIVPCASTRERFCGGASDGQ